MLDSKGEWSVPLSETHKLLTEAETLGKDTLDYLENIKAVWVELDSENIMYNATIYSTSTLIANSLNYYGNSVFKILDIFYDASADSIRHDIQADSIDDTAYYNITHEDVNDMKPFYGDLACVEGENGMIRYINKAGETIIE
ncbi:MAG: hypothetical protein ACLVO2_15255 [Clostridia bacterium]